MTEQEMTDYIRDWFPVGDPHFVCEDYPDDFLSILTGGAR